MGHLPQGWLISAVRIRLRIEAKNGVSRVSKTVIGAAAVIILAALGVFGWQKYAATPVATPETATTASVLADLPKPVDSPLTKAQDGDLVEGDANAPITMVEYSSLSCPHCAKFHNDVLPQVKADYIDTGKVKLVIRDFPLNKQAADASLFAHCVSPMRYFSIVDILFKTQDQWLVQDHVGKLAEIAATAGMDRPTFDACLADKAALEKIVASRKLAQDTFAVDSTPTFVVNGIKLSGEQQYPKLKALFDELLKPAQ